MNKKITIIILTATVLLVALLITLSIFRSTTQTSSVPDMFASPTSAPTNRGFRNTYDNNKVVPPTLEPEKQEALFTVQKFLPYNSEALAVDYSTLTNNIYIEKKNDKADEELNKFLETNSLKDLYNKHPELFKVISLDIGGLLNEENELLTETTEPLIDTQSTPTPTPNPNDPSSQAKPMMNVFKSLMGFNMTLLPYSSTTNSQSPTQQSTSSTSQSNSAAQQSSYKPSPYIQPLSPAYRQNVQYDWGNYQCINPPGQQPGAKAIQLYVNSQWGGGTGYIGNCRMSNGKYGIHAEGRGVDSYFYVGDKMQQGNATFGWLLTNAQNIGIQYIKYWRVQWAAGKGGLHCVTDARDQAVHSTHIHYELNWPGARQQTPYFTSGVNKPSTININQEVCPIVK